MIRTLLKFTLQIVITLLCIAMGLIYFLGETTLGLQTAVRLASSVMPGELHVEQAGGKLLSSFYLINVSYRSATENIAIRSLDLDWSASNLLHGKFKINRMNAQDVEIYSNTSSDQPIDFSDLAFLEYITASQITIDHFTLFQNNKTILKLNNLTFIQKENYTVNFDGELLNNNLHGNINIALRNNQLHIQEANIAVANSNMHVAGTLANDWNMRWNISIPDVSNLFQNSHGAFYSAGTVIGPRLTPIIRAELRGNQLAISDHKINQLAGRAKINFAADTFSELALIANGIKIHNYTAKKVDVGIIGHLTKSNNKTDVQFNISIAKKPYVQMSVSVPITINFDNYLTKPLSAKSIINIPTLKALNDFIPAAKALTGAIHGTLELHGTLSQPKLNGNINLVNGNFSIPKLGITLKNITLSVHGNETGRLTYTGSFQSAPGTAQLDGTTNFTQAGFPTEITLRGNNLQAVNLPEYKLSLTPDIKIHFVNAAISIQGKVTIPKAEITPKDFGATIMLPDDVVFVGQKTTTASSLLDSIPAMNLNVSLGDQVHIHYQDLETKLRGNLHITKESDSPATATGILNLSAGSYQAYGKILRIQDGRLIYTGGMLTNPGLNIKAIRQIKTVVVENTSSFGSQQIYAGQSQQITLGIQVFGTLNNPSISLFSVPAGLSQTDILSYLLLGKPQSQVSGSAQKSLLSALSSINMGGNGPSKFETITSTLQDTLGLTELNVESVQTFDPSANKNQGGVVGTTSLVVGKEIAPNLSLHYSVGLFNPVTILNLRYRFGKHWSIQSETSALDNGADLLYSIERE